MKQTCSFNKRALICSAIFIEWKKDVTLGMKMSVTFLLTTPNRPELCFVDQRKILASVSDDHFFQMQINFLAKVFAVQVLWSRIWWGNPECIWQKMILWKTLCLFACHPLTRIPIMLRNGQHTTIAWPVPHTSFCLVFILFSIEKKRNKRSLQKMLIPAHYQGISDSD